MSTEAIETELASASQKMSVDDICDTVTGYVLGFEKVIQETGMDVSELEELLLNHNIEKCPTCEWYVDSFELLPDGESDPDGFCFNCREPESE